MIPVIHTSSTRLAAIDQFRGLAIVLMALANYTFNIALVPAWLKHASDVGFTAPDLIAPMFLFAIGLTYTLALRRRAVRDGWLAANRYAVARYAAMIGLGAIITAGDQAFAVTETAVAWGVLQAIGLAGLLTLAVIRWSTWVRVGAGLALLAGYQLLLENGWLEIVLASSHGGLHGSLGWTALLILATVFGDVYHAARDRRGRFLLLSTLVLVAGLVLAPWVPVSKHRISASYVLVSLGLCGLLFAAFVWLAEVRRVRLPWLEAWGCNPLALYLLHYVLLGIVVLPGIPGWHAAAPLWLVVVQAALLLAILGGLALRWRRRGWRWSL
ncbi:MAG: DUF1624 domain-containing protein [Anaerolineae bacterium]|nr:DUF1624 domain-containing protein [Anaerolineae bacterium]